MRALVRYFCAPERNSLTRELEPIYVVIDIPFVPHEGMAIKVTEDGDYLTVGNVYWSLNRPDLLDIGLREPEKLSHAPKLAGMKAEGWRLGDPDPETI